VLSRVSAKTIIGHPTPKRSQAGDKKTHFHFQNSKQLLFQALYLITGKSISLQSKQRLHCCSSSLQLIQITVPWSLMRDLAVKLDPFRAVCNPPSVSVCDSSHIPWTLVKRTSPSPSLERRYLDFFTFGVKNAVLGLRNQLNRRTTDIRNVYKSIVLDLQQLSHSLLHQPLQQTQLESVIQHLLWTMLVRAIVSLVRRRSK
jgi:hypothetical protein